MQQIRARLAIGLAGGLAAALPGLGCGSSVSSTSLSPSSTQCSSNVVQLGIGEGYLQHLCGCSNLAVGAVSIQPTTGFTCTGPAPTASTPTVVIFVYINPLNSHQILAVSSSVNGFASGPLVDPKQEDQTIRAHSLSITATGNYDFRDAFNSAIVGRITL